jgi:hypothetical protein
MFERDKLGRGRALQKLADTPNNFSDADRAIKYCGQPWAPGRTFPTRKQMRQSFPARGDQNRGDTLDEFLNGGVADNLGRAFEHQGRGHLACGKGAPDVLGRFHAQCLDAQFAQLGADGCAQCPIARDHKNNRHLGGGV